MTPAALNSMLDRAEGLRRAGGDAALYRDLLKVFLADVPRLLGLLDMAASQPSARALRHAAHSLKGSASAIGASGIAQQACSLEQMARSDRAADAADPLRHLQAELRTLAEGLNVELAARKPQEAS
jgi:HPt (histidine-containing phosphotransfer) domain-containing protein